MDLHGLEDETVADIVLAVDELAANGLAASPGGDVAVEVRTDQVSVGVTVSNRGRPVDISSADGPLDTGPDSTSWSGLVIVDRLVGPVSVFSAEGRTLAMFTKRAH